MGREPEQTYFQRRHTDGQNTHEKMFNATNHQQVQMKTTMNYHLMPVRMTSIKKTKITSIRKDMEKRESTYTVGGNVK